MSLPAPVIQEAKDSKPLVPCSSLDPGTVHLGDSCLSVSTDRVYVKVMLRRLAALISGNFIPTLRLTTTGCTGGKGRVTCSAGSTGVGGRAFLFALPFPRLGKRTTTGYPLCEELDAFSCGIGCSCWSSCREQQCSPLAFPPGRIPFPNTTVMHTARNASKPSNIGARIHLRICCTRECKYDTRRGHTLTLLQFLLTGESVRRHANPNP
ncbi:uncharacterized protein LOC113146541 [Cyclospora cayetanensis]|uniref:Uncharacterized protein LOC113146541 n=1 Tax=Cyclospora cayetanensis TaxID=88456 RepID=A0A6P6RR06_9EIME|nr:uncharacterized protein LOC113146541 [Cyclospora cayetanensis]